MGMICENFSLVCHRDKAQKIVSEAAALREKNRLQGQIELGFHPFFIEHVLSRNTVPCSAHREIFFKTGYFSTLAILGLKGVTGNSFQSCTADDCSEHAPSEAQL